MSAIALHDINLRDIDSAVTSRSRRRNHLRLVTAGEFPVSARVATLAPGQRSMTLTRRGRLAIALTVAAVLVLAMAAALAVFPAAASAGHTVVVGPGQTLSQIAVTELPDMPVDRAIVQIQLANNMNSLDVQAGATLEIPQR